MNFSRPLILGSSSPRRQFLMREAGFEFKVIAPEIDESFPSTLPVTEIPSFLAKKKAKVFESRISNEEVVITSDTVVILDELVLNKPVDRSDAIRMLTFLKGRTHTVITAVCLLSKDKIDCFDDRTNVTFRDLSLPEIEFYVDHYQPLDKAGAYGAQDCLPAGMNPCSKEEIEFLKEINKPDILKNTLAEINAQKKIAIIEKMEGAYFTVMGLPLHQVYKHLGHFQEE